ncbi:MAG: hypothetical protein JWL87_418 [Candidatus Adlerbacteria bacterium]|nr:hypothetical protein [Candidatus Adlerbacteria bacterium]
MPLGTFATVCPDPPYPLLSRRYGPCLMSFWLEMFNSLCTPLFGLLFEALPFLALLGIWTDHAFLHLYYN